MPVTPTAPSSRGMCIAGDPESATYSAVAFIWTAATGMKAIEGFPEGTVRSSATSISADGKRIVGWYEIADNGEDNTYGTFGFLWEQGQDLQTFSDFIPDNVSNKHFCSLNGISADGQVIAATMGYMPVDTGDAEPVIVSVATRLTKVGSGWESRMLGWTPDGDRTDPNWRQRASSTSAALSADGSAIWGTTEIPDIGFFHPFRWTPTTGMAINMWNQVFVMQASSHDGELAVGGGADPGNGIIWDSVRGVRSMYGVMDGFGILDQMGDYQVVTMFSVSADGQAMVGVCGTGTGSASGRAPVVWPPKASGEIGMFRGFYVEIPRENDQNTNGFPD